MIRFKKNPLKNLEYNKVGNSCNIKCILFEKLHILNLVIFDCFYVKLYMYFEIDLNDILVFKVP